MTIALSINVNDGLVLAADSAATIVGSPGSDGVPASYNVYNNANKIFNLRKGLPVGVITWGAGSVGNASISTLIKDLRRTLSAEYPLPEAGRAELKKFTVEDLASRVATYIYEKYFDAFAEWPEDRMPYLGLIVAGYSSDAELAEEFQIDIQGTTCEGPTKLWQTHEASIVWRGQIEAISRLLLGFSPQLPEVLEKALGVEPDLIEPAMQIIKQELGSTLLSSAMPLQDAIDVASFLVHVAIQHSRFLPGPQVVGGPIELASISKHEGFKWVTRKHYFTKDLNPLED